MVVEVQQFVPFKDRATPKSSNIYIKNLPDGLTKEEIETIISEKFGSFGEITSKGVF